MLSVDRYRTIYEMLDKVSPLSYDCGRLCNGICCSDESFTDEEPCIYLLPGEREYLLSEGCESSIIREPRREHDLPKSWGKYVYLFRCDGTELCDRAVRPIQCRTFPLEPHIDENGNLEMIYASQQLPYSCPIIRDGMALSDDFRRVTYEAWKLLTEDDAIRDLISQA